MRFFPERVKATISHSLSGHTRVFPEQVSAADSLSVYLFPPLLLLCRFDAALQEAGEADKLIVEEMGGEKVLEDRLPLLGVPLSVKEAFALQGTQANC